MSGRFGISRRMDGYAPIGAYAAISDGKSLALVAAEGSIDRLCLPELSAAVIFDESASDARGERPAAALPTNLSERTGIDER